MLKFKGSLFVLLVLVLLKDSRTDAQSQESAGQVHHHPHHHEHHDHEHHDHEHGHDHLDHLEHEHLEERPHYKYSREANEKYSKPQESSPSEPEIKPASRSAKEIWVGAIGSTLLISLAPYLVLYFIPINSPNEHQSLLKVLLSFASGGLLGDAFLHLIPHALIAQQELEHKNDAHHSHGHHSHGHTHGHSHGHSHAGHDHEHHSHDMSVGLYVLSGILAFLMIEKFVRIVKGSHHHHHHHPHSDSHHLHGEVSAKESDSELSEHEKEKPDKSKAKKSNELKESEAKGNPKKVRFDDNLEIIHYEKLPNGTNNQFFLSFFFLLPIQITHQYVPNANRLPQTADFFSV